jgi:hypothetical protein
MVLLAFVPFVLSFIVGGWLIHSANKRRALDRALLAPAAAAAVYFASSSACWYALADITASRRGQPACGAFGFLMILAVVGGTIAELIVGYGALLCWWLWSWFKAKVASA